MEIAQIMQRLEASQKSDNAGIKTASVATTSGPSVDALRAQLRQVINSGSEKTASAASPTQQAPLGDLHKMASDLANAEEEALLKQAQVYGAAIADGFMARYAQYEDAANAVAPAHAPAYATAQKTAGAGDDFQKFASENPELTKEAFDLGYRTKMAALQKEANEQFAAGYNDTMNEVHKTASALYKHGAEWGQWAVKTAEQAQQR